MIAMLLQNPGSPAPLPPVPPTPPDPTQIPPEMFMTGPPIQMVENVTVAFFATIVFIVVGWPIARAIARWLDRKGVAAAPDPEISRRLERIETAIEAMAIEVERISEGQRFTTKLLSDLRAPAAIPAQGSRAASGEQRP